MRIRGIHVRRYRSLARTSIRNCGPLNVFIGKNNSGKSNILSTITLVQSHLRRGTIAGAWDSSRAIDEFTDRETQAPLQIGIDFDLPKPLNEGLRERLKKEAPHLDVSIDQLRDVETLGFVLAGSASADTPFLYVQQIAAGPIDASREDLSASGITLLSVSLSAAREFFGIQQAVAQLEAERSAVERLRRRPDLEHYFSTADRRYLPSIWREDVPSTMASALQDAVRNSGTYDQFSARLADLASEKASALEAMVAEKIAGTVSTFAGESKTQPEYVAWLLREYSRLKLLNLGERRTPIGEEEAAELLRLKVRRGGSERLRAVQTTVQSLLGVAVDAFEADTAWRRQGASRSRGAEMDVDEFLAEANGAGIREALRVILDLELKEPQLAIVEEPEVHLHPGLEHALYTYLRDKSSEVQLFVTTHSTNFIDSISFQNIYLVSRESDRWTRCEEAVAGDASLRIPTELGLRLSTVFMFDRLVFVEGASDEAVLREVARRCSVDLTSANLAFVQMGGVRNIGHFAIEGTIDLLTRRRVRMSFVIDRDEKDDQEIAGLMQKLGDQAVLRVHPGRELENYLLHAGALARFISSKRGTRGPVEEDDVQKALSEEADALKDEVVRLRLHQRALTPIVFQARGEQGTVEDRLRAGREEIEARVQRVEEERSAIARAVEREWASEKLRIVPGAELLDRVCRRFDVRFRKDRGDSVRLLREIPESSLPHELTELVRSLTR